MLTDERPTGSEALKPVARDVDGRRAPVEDQLGQTLADRGRRLEARSREPAGEVEAIRSRLTEDPVLVGGDPVLATVAPAERSVRHPRHPGTHSADHLLDELWVCDGERAVRRAADVIATLKPDEHRLAA